jgi:CubicO group peptidase (beta-lactamase class C family)
MIKTLAVAIVIAITSALTHAQNFESKIDSLLFTVFKDKNGPGAVFMIAKDGKSIYQKAFGKANLEVDVDLTPENVFQLGSITKQFSAIAVLMLEEQGKISTDNVVSKFLPDYPNGHNITIHHLLTHTSGIKDFTKMNSLRDIAQREMTPRMMVEFFKNEPVDFAPGESFEYNNSGYILLGYIIELASGMSYEDFIVRYIFQKLAMNRSRYATDRQLINKRAYGYQQKESGYVNRTIINFSVPYSSGALMSTSGDMLKWQNALNKNILLKEENSKKAFYKYRLN